MKVVFLTNYPSPYRVWFFNELGKKVDLTVLFTENVKDQSHRATAWFDESYENFNAVFLKEKIKLSNNQYYYKDAFQYYKEDTLIILGGYSSLTQILTITYLRWKKIPFYLEIDGGLIRKDKITTYLAKKFLISSASGWLSSGKTPTEYLRYYGADSSRIYQYRFSSLWARDICDAVTTPSEKQEIRSKLQLTGSNVVLFVGNCIHRKGIDVLIRAAARLNEDLGIYVVGGNPPAEYLKLRDELCATNVHFVGFKEKAVLKEYYKAADLFVMPTREDIWGLVINEAMAAGLPIITTDRCVAGLELVVDGENGYIVPVENDKEIALAIEKLLHADCSRMGQRSLARIKSYTIENMVETHLEILEQISQTQR